jgi:hypothetical protein
VTASSILLNEDPDGVRVAHGCHLHVPGWKRDPHAGGDYMRSSDDRIAKYLI